MCSGGIFKTTRPKRHDKLKGLCSEQTHITKAFHGADQGVVPVHHALREFVVEINNLIMH